MLSATEISSLVVQEAGKVKLEVSALPGLQRAPSTHPHGRQGLMLFQTQS